jgi:hypothetical protein
MFDASFGHPSMVWHLGTMQPMPDFPVYASVRYSK